MQGIKFQRECPPVIEPPGLRLTEIVATAATRLHPGAGSHLSAHSVAAISEVSLFLLRIRLSGVFLRSVKIKPPITPLESHGPFVLEGCAVRRSFPVLISIIFITSLFCDKLAVTSVPVMLRRRCYRAVRKRSTAIMTSRFESALCTTVSGLVRRWFDQTPGHPSCRPADQVQPEDCGHPIQKPHAQRPSPGSVQVTIVVSRRFDVGLIIKEKSLQGETCVASRRMTLRVKSVRQVYPPFARRCREIGDNLRVSVRPRRKSQRKRHQNEYHDRNNQP